jgi:lipoate-protein ligase A
VAPPPWELLCEVLGEPPEDAAVLAARTASCSQILGPQATAKTLAPSLLLRLVQSLSQLEAAPRPDPIAARADG